MAHITDGILSTEVTVVAGTLAAAGVAYALKTMDRDDIPKIALIAAVFLVVSTLRIPLPGTSAHLVLAGLMGIVLGWQVFPALLVAFVLQLVFFGYGGITALGSNVLNIALPALLTAALFRPLLNRCDSKRLTALFGFGVGFTGVALVGLCLAGSLALSGQEFLPTAQLVLASHGVVMVVEGLVSASAIGLVSVIRPDILRPA